MQISKLEGIVLNTRKGSNGKLYAEVAVLGLGAFSCEASSACENGQKVSVAVELSVYQGRLNARARI